MKSKTPLLIGVDAGASKTRIVAADARGRLFADVAGPGTSVTAQGPVRAAAQIAKMVSALAGRERISGMVVGLAGAWSPPLSRQVARHLRRELAVPNVLVANDALAVLMAAPPKDNSLLLAVGTGAVLAGRSAGGRRTVRVDGWGPLGGDAGSGYWIGLKALQASLAAYDGRTRNTAFTRRVLGRMGLRPPADGISALHSDPLIGARIAGLAPLVIRAGRRGDPVARRIIGKASRNLAEAVRAGLAKMPPGRVRLILTGGLMQDNPELLSGIRGLARKKRRRLLLDDSPRVPALECLRLAARRFGKGTAEGGISGPLRGPESRPPRPLRILGDSRLPVTERSNPATALFSRLPIKNQLELLSAEDSRVAPAVAAILPRLEKAIRAISARMKRGGRLIYVGAGTSGRLGVLDAAEAPPTFGVDPGLVRGVIAGGERALRRSVEGAEDDHAAGARDLGLLKLRSRDSVVGLSAGGNAPYVLGALARARRRGALCVGITCNPRSRLARFGGMALVVRVGPEAIAGSTRLKAGTAQKLLLNAISTCVMAALGRIRGNAMIRMVPRNRKLKARAVRIAAEALGMSQAEARRLLIEKGWDLGSVTGG